MKFNKYIFKKDFVLKDNKIFLTEGGLIKARKKLKKITGSRIAGALGKNNFSTPFKTWCDILGFFEPEIETFFTQAGTKIENKLLEFIKCEFKKNYKSYKPENIGYDLFKSNKIFGGIPDGEEMSDGELISLLEIKTTPLDKYKWKREGNEFKLVRDTNNLPKIEKYGGNLSKWFLNKKFIVPQEYQYQLSLYLYLRNIPTGYFCVSFLNMNDYLNPDAFSPYETNYDYSHLKENSDIPDNLHDLNVSDRIIVFEQMTIDLKKFEKIINYLTDWYEYHIYQGISPELTSVDLEWIRGGYPDL